MGRTWLLWRSLCMEMERDWYFDTDKNATFVMKNRDMIVPWEFIYQNRQILVRVDNNGLVNCQANPPRDIMLFKREWNEKYSKWLVWIKSDCVNNGKAISCFDIPKTDISGEKPQDVKITYSPESAVYEYTYLNMYVKTELIVPVHGAKAILRTTVKNVSKERQTFDVTPCFMPYINQAMLAPWDKPEWYMRTNVSPRDEQLCFSTQLLSPSGDKSKRRFVTMLMDGGFTSVENSLEHFVGNGEFNCPSGVNSDNLRLGAAEAGAQCDMCGYPPVYAARYKCELGSSEEKIYTQVLKMHDNNGGFDGEDDSFQYFSKEHVKNELSDISAFYNNIFSKRTVSTNDKMFDNYVNTFLPLQMYWVASLDRGWPTGMRGVRDCANDFMGMMTIDRDWAGEILCYLMSCQRSDGYCLRQISTDSKRGKHDVRPYVDGGAFFLEFFYEYMCFSGDVSLLDTEVDWLDSDEKTPALLHALKALEFYLDKKNIGEHGLVKIYEGDWLDSVNRAGLNGRGESVMVTNQVIMAIDFMRKIIDYAREKGAKSYDKGMENLKLKYTVAAKEFKDNLIKHAYNEGGYFSSVFTDGGEWIFSDSDSDGERRVYGVCNYYSIISGVATPEMQKSIMKNVEVLKSDMGYRLFYPPLGKKPVDYVGRMASGDQVAGLWENGAVYNHGSQGFLCRALARLNEKDELFKVIEYMLPYSQEKHPISETLSAPYAIVNCYQGIDCFSHRAGMPFLTGTIAMIMRAVYNWMFGIEYRLNGIAFNPCLKPSFTDSRLDFDFRGKKFNVRFIKSQDEYILFNGKKYSGNFVDVSDFKEINEVIIYYI